MTKLQGGKLKEGLELIDKRIAALDGGNERLRMMLLRFQVLLELGETGKLAQSIKELIPDVKKRPEILNRLAWSIVELADTGKEIDQDLLQVALDAAQTAVDKEPGKRCNFGYFGSFVGHEWGPGQGDQDTGKSSGICRSSSERRY